MLASMLALLVIPLAASPAYPQGGVQGSQAHAPVGLTIVMVDVGQGDGIVVRAPDGQVHAFDAGPESQGLASMVPMINSLQPTSYGYTVLSHFHTDHQGGLDDLLNMFAFQVALDRGDANRASNSSINSYLAAAGGRRQLVSVGATYQLGGGATMTCICANGSVMGGAFVNPAQAQEENARSLVMRLDYGDFSMWIGGDLTGGGNSTADVEGPASIACGDVDVYKLNHHGSNTSTSINLIANLDPELAVVSCGTGNGFGHPTTTITNRINQAVASRALLSTTTGSRNTIGFGVSGDLRIDTDGYRYRATAENGDFLDFYCDEVIPEPVAAGDIRISEVHRNPSVVSDTNGEYIEVVNIGSKPIALAGLSLSDNAGSVTLASNYMLVPGRPMLFQLDGAPSRNGGQPLGAALPYNSVQFANTTDVVVLQQGVTTIDALSYVSGFPGGNGVAAERVDLLAPHNSGGWNYVSATPTFGSGDLGTPGATNFADATTHPVQIGVTVRPDRFTLHGTALDHGGSNFSVIGLSYGANIGFPFGGAQIPLNADPLFSATLGIGGLLALMPADGYRSLDVMIPQPNPIPGIAIYAAHIMLDINLMVPGVSPAVSFILP
ncbi:MAG: beta-lactamase superfamily II metal-dependent hydrolase [Planctomycetota bacterium]|jgi:beta-lactamase superfamily II metal-dependent hydrolase